MAKLVFVLFQFQLFDFEILTTASQAWRKVQCSKDLAENTRRNGGKDH